MITIKKIITFILFFMFIHVNSVYAATFSDVSYKTAQDYNIVATKVVAESSKQAISLYNLMSNWEIYETSYDVQYAAITEYIKEAKENYAFVKSYDTSLAKEINVAYDGYIDYLNNQLDKGVGTFVNSKVIFIDYIESNVSETHSNYLSFKRDGLDKFLNTQIYTKTNQKALSDLVSTYSADRKQGKEKINNTITNLEKIAKDNSTPVVIKNYAEKYIDHYKKALNNDFSDTDDLILCEKDRVNGLIPVADVAYEKNEYLNYYNVFEGFTDYPTLQVSLNIKSKSLEKQLKLVVAQNPKTKNIQRLKQLHYEFLYELSEYKKDTSNNTKALKAYNDFYQFYCFLESYYSKIDTRFSNFQVSNLLTNIDTIKNYVSCLNPNYPEIQDMKYSLASYSDGYSYRSFLIAKDKKSILNIFIKGSLTFLIIFAIVFVLIKCCKYYNTHKNHYDDDFYD